ncbi:MAG TPA: ABC transporter permease subunit, partial [Stellaceae bacterium]|nr:ABC transporter permease subunit [Stellaceae bacterium]
HGVALPVPAYHPVYPWMLAAFLLGLVLAFLVKRRARQYQARTGRRIPDLGLRLFFIVAPPLVLFLIFRQELTLDLPVLVGFNFRGGVTPTPEMAALAIGLIVYTAAFIAEIVRGGIEAVGRGQSEAALALGFRRLLVLRLVILPQALRVILPPLTSEYLNLVKNSTLAVAIGFFDFFSVANTTLNQTGQAIEVMAIVALVYLSLSLTLSVMMNAYDRRVALVER